MCSLLPGLHCEARTTSTVPVVRQETPEAASKLRCFELVVLTAVGALVVLTSGAMAQQQEVSPPVLTSGLHSAVPAPTPAIEKSSQRAAAKAGFDVATVPPIDSVDAGSDIRPFLTSGVPDDLTRAALRRAWSTDPAIRDFIGLSENSWDFNAPSGVSEFGVRTRSDTRQPRLEEAKSLDPARLAAEPSTRDLAPGATGDALRSPGSAPIK